MSERTATSMARQIKRTKELDGDVEKLKAEVAEKTLAIEQLKNVTGVCSA